MLVLSETVTMIIKWAAINILQLFVTCISKFYKEKRNKLYLFRCFTAACLNVYSCLAGKFQIHIYLSEACNSLALKQS